MTSIFRLLAIAAVVAAGSTASAAVVVYTPTSVTPTTSTSFTAVPLSVGQFVTIADTMTPGNDFQFEFTALSAMRISNIALSATGQTLEDISNIEFGFTSVTTGNYTPFNLGGVFSGIASLPGFSLDAGEKFSIWWEDEGIVFPVSFGASFRTAEIPVPAALPLLLGGIAALGVASRKKRS